MKIGVFDSGIGGEAISQSLSEAFPLADIVTVNDKANLPYGSKENTEIINLTEKAIKPLLKSKCDIIVIACNTATTLALPYLRRTYPQQKFIGIEPMIKPSVEKTRSGIVCVCATPRTLQSARYQNLKSKYAPSVKTIEPDCSQWAYMIENNTINYHKIRKTIDDALSKGADVIVLGCTHYHWIKTFIEEIAENRAVVIEPSNAIARRVHDLYYLEPR